MSLLDLFLPVRAPIREFRRISSQRRDRSGYDRAYYLANKERIAKRYAAYYERNRIKLLAKAKKHHEEHKEARNAARRARYIAKDIRRSGFIKPVPLADRPCCDCGGKRYVAPAGRVSAYCLPCKLARQRKRHAERKAER